VAGGNGFPAAVDRGATDRALAVVFQGKTVPGAQRIQQPPATLISGDAIAEGKIG